MTQKQTEVLEDLKTRTDIWIQAADIAPLLETTPQAIRDQAHRDPAALGFPAVVVGSRIKIPRRAFLRWLGE